MNQDEFEKMRQDVAVRTEIAGNKLHNFLVQDMGLHPEREDLLAWMGACFGHALALGASIQGARATVEVRAAAGREIGEVMCKYFPELAAPQLVVGGNEN